MIRGTNHDQDARFEDKTKRMLEKSNWPEKYDIKIDLKKVDYELIKIWIQKKITQLLGEQDDIISGTLISHLDEHLQKQQKLNAKKLHIAISGFLQQKTLTFMSQFWDILDEAQRSSRGIPECLIEEKKKSEHMHRKKIDEVNLKRHKINTNYFNNLVKPLDSSRVKQDYRREDQEQRQPKQHREVKQDKEDDHKRTKKHHRDRSRSKNKHKKHRSRSIQKNKRQRQREPRRTKQRKRNSSSELQATPKPKHKKNQKRRRSEESDSSGVVSSSDSES